MKQVLALRRETVGRGLTYMSRALLAALLAGARIYGGYAPCAVGIVAAAGPGWEGLFALVGAGLGALQLLDFPHALRTMACSLLLFTANNAFCELRVYGRPWFRPVLTGVLTLAVEVIYVVRAGSAEEAAYCLAALLLAALFAHCGQLVFSAPDARRTQPTACLILLLGVLTALSAAQFQSGFAPGRIAAVLAVILFAFDRERAFALAAALCVGLAMDLATPGQSFLHAASYCFGALLVNLLHHGSRVRAAVVFALSAVVFTLPLGAEAGIALLYEALAGTLAFLLLPARVLRSPRGETSTVPIDGAQEDSLRERLRQSAAALWELYESVSRTEPPPEENPAIIFDRAAEAVCRDCSLRELCWEREYGRTYNALNDATAELLQNGVGSGEEFPAYFAERCIRFASFLGAVNAEVHAFLLRRQYRARLDAAQTQAAGQYAQLSELLSQTAERGAAPAAATASLPYCVGVTLRPKGGERLSGDSASTFETPDGSLCLLLSDGMGSGEAAQRESGQAVRLIERFLRAGINAQSALKTLNGALNLRAERSKGFTTVDLLTLSLKNGEGEVYKYGAAPSYIKRGRQVRRVNCSCLPAGLAGGAEPPEMTHIRLESGSFFVMVTDGVADGTDDEWLENLLAQWQGESPQQLVSAILADSYDHKGTGDDAGVLALYLPGNGTQAAREV